LYNVFQMDARTAQYYDENAEAVFARHQSVPSPVAKYIKLAFPPGGEILDIGAGSGRDMQTLMREQYAAYGVEPCEPMRRIAIGHDPRLVERLMGGSLPGLSSQIDRKFDGIICSAVFMHIPAEQHFDCAFDIRNLLKSYGRLILSVPRTRPDVDEEGRDSHGRLFVPIVPESLELLFERLGFQRIGKWEDEDALGRRGITWTTLLFELTSGGPTRPIDQIEGVLNRDRKVATYKLALFRALCDIALTSYRLAEWRQDGSVGVPIHAVAERWIQYYWPLLEDDGDFIPQIRGESRDSRLHIGFRPQLERLIAAFRKSGGLDGFAIASDNAALDPAQNSVLKALLSRLAHVIVEGPVAHAGATSEAGVLFSYDGRRRQIVVGTEIWRELSLSGHWIHDALILRWAELTSEISRKVISPSEVIERLLRTPVRERNVLDARRIYSDLPSRECVWSGTTLGSRFDVDHVLPFSLWRNNDLWNLLPANPQANRDKGESLPTNALLKRRRDVILKYWHLLHDASPKRFEHEVSRLSGTTGLHLPRTFEVVVEAVEVTALQRGCLRWEP
jgi:hypothetical protein